MARRIVLVAAIAATIGIAGWLGAGCSVSKAVIGSSKTTVAPTTTSLAATGSTGASGQSSTNTTRLVEGGKTAEQYAAEIPDLQKAVDANPQDLTALQNLAVAQYNAREFDAAGTTYQKMLQIKDDPTTHNNYANVLRDQSKFGEAEAEYQKAITGDPALTIAYINLSSTYKLQGNVSEAEKILDQGIVHTSGADKQRLQDYKTKVIQAK